MDFIHEAHLEKSISKRMNIYEKYSNGKPIKTFINVGGGIASLGNTINGKLIPVGLTQNLPMSNFPVHGVIIQMAQNAIPIIHLLNISQLLEKYGLPNSPDPLPEPGEGKIFVQEKYSILITSLAVIFLLVVVILVYIVEKKHHQLGTDPVPLANIQKANKHETDSILDL